MASLKANNTFLEGFELIALTLQASSIGSIDRTISTKGFSTNTFEVPKTETNLKALGFPQVDDDLTEYTPSTRIPAELSFNSYTESGYLQITSVSESSISLTFYSGNTDWFEDIGETTINDYQYPELDHVWDKTNISNSWDGGEDYYYPIVDWGTQATQSAASIAVDDFYPFARVKYLLRRALNSLGYKPTGDFWNKDALLNSYIIPVRDNNLIYSQRFRDERNFDARFPTDYIESFIVTNPVRISPLVVDPDASACTVDAFGSFSLYDNTNAIYNPDQTYTITFSISLSVTANDYSGVRIYLADDAAGANDIAGANITTPQTYTFSTARLVNPTEEYALWLSYSSVGTTFTITACTSLSFFKGTVQSAIQPDSTFNFDGNLPDVKIKDILKKIIFDNALVVQTTPGREITFERFDNIKNKEYVDWSSKFLTGEPVELNFTEFLSNYSRVNNCTYLNDDDDTEINTYEERNKETFGSGQLNVVNAFVTGEGDLFENEFAGTKIRESYDNGGNSLQIPYIPFTVDAEDYTPEPRILFSTGKFNVSSIGSGYTQITLDSTNYSQVGYAHFYKPEISAALNAVKYSLAYKQQNIPSPNDSNILTDNWGQIQRILDKPKGLKASFLLNDLDIVNLDFSRPIYLDVQYKEFKIQGLYFLQKVEEYTGEQDPTECELIKLV